ncbi:unnamed protein product, partial [Ectocarpus fasciculatus]
MRAAFGSLSARKTSSPIQSRNCTPAVLVLVRRKRPLIQRRGILAGLLPSPRHDSEYSMRQLARSMCVPRMNSLLQGPTGLFLPPYPGAITLVGLQQCLLDLTAHFLDHEQQT